jgi:preprotein translocase subunit SecF
VEFIKRYLDNLEIDFVGKRKPAAVVSVLLVLMSWAVFFGVGPNWGIDFTGGTEIILKFDQKTEIGEIRTALSTLGLSNDAVQSINGSESNEFSIRIQQADFGMEQLRTEVEGALVGAYGADWIAEMQLQAEVGARFVVNYTGQPIPNAEIAKVVQHIGSVQVQSGKEDLQVVITAPGLASQIQGQIAGALGNKSFEVLSIDAVGPKVGADLRVQGATSVLATLALVLLYVAFRFDVGFAPGAIAALFHDVSVVVGIFVLAQLEFNLPMIGALLTIVGYSLNDTIVIYDRIRENRDRHRRTDLPGLLNVSINETLTRTVATSVTTLLAITMLLFMGGPVIRNFALAMCLGIIFGTYSTVFVATPLILFMEDVKPTLRKLIATPVTADGPGGYDLPEGDMTASETRRRERAEADRRDLDAVE